MAVVGTAPLIAGLPVSVQPAACCSLDPANIYPQTVRDALVPRELSPRDILRGTVLLGHGIDGVLAHLERGDSGQKGGDDEKDNDDHDDNDHGHNVDNKDHGDDDCDADEKRNGGKYKPSKGH